MSPPEETPRTVRQAILETLARRGWGGAVSEEPHLQTVCLMILTGLALGGAAWWLRDVLVPFVFAVFLAFALRPLVDLFQHRLRLPHGLATALTLGVGILVMVGLAAVVSASVMQLTQSGEDYQARVSALLARVLSWSALQRFGLDPRELLSSLVDTSADSFGAVLGSLFNSLFALVSHGVIVLIYLFFLLFGSWMEGNREGVWGDIRSSIEDYLAAKAAISLVVGALTWLVLDLLNVRLALVFGLLAFALNFIPNLGPIVATLLPLPVVILTPDVGLGTASLALLVPGAIHLVVGHLAEPRIMGKSLELDPVVVLLALMLASVVWGPVGMLLATPMAAVARILLERGDRTRPLARLLKGRPEEVGRLPVPEASAGEESAPSQT